MSRSYNIERRVNTWTDEDALAFDTNSKCYRNGISLKEVLEQYSLRSETYDQELADGRYNGPAISAQIVADYFPEDRQDKKIIDIAAGTGLVGHHLKVLGFEKLDALEPSLEMQKHARRKGLYHTYYNHFLSDDPLPIPQNTYDCAVCCGGMGEGHIPCSGIIELTRITKPGGLICIVMREEYLYDVDEYNDRLEPLMDSLETAGKWRKISREIKSNYLIDIPGVVFKYRVI